MVRWLIISKSQVSYRVILQRFLYDFVTFPNGVFSGTIISSVIKNSDIKKTAEWQLLLGSIALPGVIIGAMLVDTRLGRKYTVSDTLISYLIP